MTFSQKEENNSFVSKFINKSSPKTVYFLTNTCLFSKKASVKFCLVQCKELSDFHITAACFDLPPTSSLDLFHKAVTQRCCRSRFHVCLFWKGDLLLFWIWILVTLTRFKSMTNYPILKWKWLCISVFHIHLKLITYLDDNSGRMALAVCGAAVRGSVLPARPHIEQHLKF